jgi:hypothetical protein
LAVPSQCEHSWSGLRCQLWAGHLSAHAAREDGAVISWRSDEHGDRVVLDWAVQQQQDGHRPSDSEASSVEDTSVEPSD